MIMNYEEKILRLRDKRPPEVFKAVRFRNEYPERFSGHLIYLRDFYPEYSLTEGDVLDERILGAIRNLFENANTVYSQLLLTDQQLENCLKWTRGGEQKDITFCFLPETDQSTYLDLDSKGTLKYYCLPLRATFLFNKSDPKLELVPDEIVVHVPLNDLESRIGTIKYV